MTQMISAIHVLNFPRRCARLWMCDTGYSKLDAGYWLLDTGFFELRVDDRRLKVQGKKIGSKVQGAPCGTAMTEL